MTLCKKNFAPAWLFPRWTYLFSGRFRIISSSSFDNCFATGKKLSRGIFFSRLWDLGLCVCAINISLALSRLSVGRVLHYSKMLQKQHRIFLLLATRGTGALLISRWKIYKCRNTRPCVAFEPDSSRKMSEGRQAREKSQLCISFSDTLFDAQLRCVHELGFETKEYKIRDKNCTHDKRN